MENIQYLSLDIMNNHIFEYAYSKQYDEGRTLIFTVTENGLPYDLTGVLATFQMKKPDNTIILDNGIIEDNKIKIIITSQMTILQGRIPYQIQLMKDENIITTVTGFFKVAKSVVDPDDVISSDEFNALNDALKKVNEDYTYVMESAQASADAAKESQIASKTSETNAKISEENAAQSSSNAGNYEKSAKTYSESANRANQSAMESSNNATYQATQALNFATKAQSYAIGGSGSRDGEDTDSAKYYYEQAKSISESFSGALRPMGTVIFANLPSLSIASEGDMYNVSDQFTTTSSFKEGIGNVIPAGANVYKTSDGYWDVLAGSPVTGIKGNSELSYRKGNVNLTADDIGAISVKLLTNENLNDIRTPGFYYAAGGNSVTSKPSGVNHFGLLCERTGNSVYTQILEDPAANTTYTTYKRKYDSGSWSAWVRDGDITGDVNLSGNLYLDKESKIHINENGLMLMNESGDEYLGNLPEVYLKKNELFDLIYPVGSIYMSVNNVNPSTLFTGTTWAAWGSGRVPVGVDTDNTNFNSVEKTGGSDTVTLTEAQMPSHHHVVGAHSHGVGTLTASNNGAHTHTATTSINSAGDHIHTASNGASYIAVKEGSYNNSTKITTGSGSYYGAIGNTAGGISRIGMSTNGNHTHTATTTTKSDGVHSHPIVGTTANSEAFNSGDTGSGQAHNNLQPYITCYMWKRTS